MSKGRILIVDDEKDIRFLLGEILGDEGYTVAEAPHSEAAFAEFAKAMPDLVILDIWLENSERDGMEILADLKKKSRTLPVLMISGHGNIEMAVKAIKLGAYDFIEKPFNTDRLLNMVGRAMESGRLRRTGAAMAVQLIGATPDMQAVHKAAAKAAQGDARVLVSGAWGSGREHLARWIHQESPRAAKPFITLGCTDADAGAFADHMARAGEGTLVLADVQAASPALQAAILAQLNAKPQARVMATALPGLKGAGLKEAGFLADLYDRLSVTSIELPDLNDRKADIPELAQGFLGEGYALADDAALALKRREWPGHVAELKALIGMAAVRMMLENSRTLHARHLVAEGAPGIAPPAVETHQNSGQGGWLDTDLRSAREAFERWYFENVMARFDGNVSQVAAFAGMDRTALHRKLKTLKEGDGDMGEGGERAAS